MKHLRLFVAAIAAVFGLSSYAQTWTGSDPAEGTFFLYNVGTGKFINVGDKSAGWGTNAYLTAEYGLDIQFELNEGAYNLNTRICNGGSSNYLNTALWCDQGATPWTFTKVDRSDINAYTISNGEKYIVANEAGTDIVYAALSGTARDQWQLIGSDDILANLRANTAEAVKRTVATFFISDPDFGRNDMRRPNWVWSNEGGNVTVPGYGFNQGNQPNYGCEFWNNTFDIHQDITKLPKGIYEFEIYGYGTNGTTYIYATTGDGTTTEKVFKNQTSASNFQTALNNIDNYSGNATGLVQVGEDGKLTIGVKRTENTSADWTVIDQARLYYYGDYTFAECYGADLKDYIEEANGLVETGKYPTADLEAAIAAANTVMETGTTEAEFAAATEAIKEAIDTYKANNEAFIALHSRYTSVKEAVLAVNSAIDTSAADALDAAATTEEGIEAAVAAVRQALLSYVSTVEKGEFDLTNAIIDNPTVSQNINYWTIENLSADGGSAGVTNYGETEFYNRTFDFFQTLKGLPVGTYEFGVTGFHRAGNHSTYFYAGEDKILIPGVESSVVNTMQQAQTYFDNGNGKVALKFALEGETNDIKVGIVNNDTETDKWTIFRNFTLKYYGSYKDYSIYADDWAKAVAAANAAIAANPNVTGEELAAVNAAIADAPDGSSKANYLEKTNALLAATQAFIAAAPAYNAYAAEKAIAEMIGVTPGEDPTTAAAAAAGVENLKIAEFNFVKDNYPYDGEGIIGNFGTWTGTATVGADRQPAEPNHLSTEHWSGPGAAYYEQAANGWGNAGGWTIKYEKTATLPAGEYMLKVAARSSAGTTSQVSCSATENTVTLPNKGATGKGIALDGTAAFEGDNFAKEGAGFGWEWRYLPFTLTERTKVTMTFYAEATTEKQWMSIANGTLLSKTEIINVVELAGDDTAAPEEGVASKIITDRKLKKGLNTIVLPFDATADEIGASTVLKYGGTHETSGKTFIHFDEVAPIDGKITLQANTPYAVIVDEDQTENIVFTSMKNIAPAENLTTADVNGQYDFVGTFAKIEPGVITENDYVARAAMNAFVPAVANDSYLNAYRAYLKFVGTEAGSVAFNIGGEIIDGIEAVELMNKLSDGIYNLNGQKVSNAQKGIYIVNGKKVVLK